MLFLSGLQSRFDNWSDDIGQDGWMASLTQWPWVEQAPGDGEGQGSLARCSPWGRKASDMTKQVNNATTEMINYVLMSLKCWFFQLGLWIECNFNQNCANCFVDIDTLILKFIGKGKRSRIGSKTLKKNQFRDWCCST